MKTFPSVQSPLTRSRSQFSPVSRRTKLEAFTREKLGAPLKRPSTDLLPAYSPRTSSPVAIGERWWTPRLLDRLQMPLTRFRD